MKGMNKPAASSAEVCLHPLRAFSPRHQRRILLLFPRFSYSFGTFNHAFPLMNVKAFMPPQGILLVAALLPKTWEARFVDENVRAATAEDFDWADVVFTTGMHIQRMQINDIAQRAHEAGKPVALGGPSVSSAPQYYADADFLHLGEAGDGTLRLFEWIDQSPDRPERQTSFRTADKLPLDQFPVPGYWHIRVLDYLLGSVQFSSGCPYACEFCDIPAVYGRNARLKSATQILEELDVIAATGATSVYFVDDNFIGNQKAAQELLPHLIEWQRQHRYPLRFACEATLNIAKNDRLLAMMREAGFITVFCGIETPEPRALRAMSKDQNLRLPLVEAADRIIAFIRASAIPVLTINVLYALPKTPLWSRLEAAGRLVGDGGRESNV